MRGIKGSGNQIPTVSEKTARGIVARGGCLEQTGPRTWWVRSTTGCASRVTYETAKAMSFGKEA